MKHAQLKICRSNLLHNYNFFKSKLNPSTKMLVLVKANGYGIGDVEVANLVTEFGADYLGVAFPCEGIKLKNAGVKLPIMILTSGVDNFSDIITYGLEPSIINSEAAMCMVEELKRKGIAEYPVHIKLDTGMQRVGFDNKKIGELKELLLNNPALKVKSVFSHLAAADDSRHNEFTNGQISEFIAMSDDIFSVLPYKPMRHILNSSGIERFTYAQFDMVRLGIGIYGTSYVDRTNLKPPASLVAPIVHIKETNEGTVGYGRYGIVGGEDKRIASIPLGYADGIDRHFSRGALSVLVNGKRAPIIGNICMDTFMIDITGIDAKIGDEVTIFGDEPSPAELAEILGTITYEIFTSIPVRVERVIVP